MRRNHVDPGRQDENEEQRQVQHVPEAEQALIERESGGLLHRRHMQRYQLGDGGDSLLAGAP